MRIGIRGPLERLKDLKDLFFLIYCRDLNPFHASRSASADLKDMQTFSEKRVSGLQINLSTYVFHQMFARSAAHFVALPFHPPFQFGEAPLSPEELFSEVLCRPISVGTVAQQQNSRQGPSPSRFSIFYYI